MQEALDLLGLSYARLAELLPTLLPGGRGVAAKVYSRAFSTGRLELEGLGLAEANRRAWETSFRVGLLRPGRRISEEGEFGPTEKAVLLLEDGAEIECVLIPMPPRADGSPRSTLCLSSQVGCRQACAFCETGRGGLLRDLSPAEVVAQYVTTRVLFGWEPNNLVFMGMGEPLDNLPGLLGALSVLTDPRGPGFSWERITVCSSGLTEGLAALRSFANPRLNLSLSLNAGDDETRSRLMPANRRAGLAALATVLRDRPRRKNFVLALNWCLLPGINDSREDAARAAAFSREVGRSIINLIPYNPGSRPLTRAPSEEEVERFAAWLEEEGCHVKRRAGKGRAIMAACGQLSGVTKLVRDSRPDPAAATPAAPPQPSPPSLQ